ncbi:MAG: hypothetical protein K8R41_05810, partial [Bacteroidales bacterium]|nr:hypothetical protein [Bacteroidales bacterium]
MKTITKTILTTILSIILIISFSEISLSQDKTDWEGKYPDGCTSITAGKQATSDGSVLTSHTCDSHR